MAKASGKFKLGQDASVDLEAIAKKAFSFPVEDLRGLGLDSEGEKAVEDTVEGVLKAEVEAEAAVEPPKVEEVKPTREQRMAAQADRHLVRELRKNDPPTKRTCAVCKRRVPMHKIDFGQAEICDDCK